MTGSERSIYLAGPMEADDDPQSWRDDLRERFPEVDWIDPMDWQDDFEDPIALWERDMEAVRNNPVLVYNIGDEAPRTTGTHHEIREALYNDQPVGIVPEGNVSWIYRDVLNVWLYEEVEHAVADLTCPELVDDGLRADGSGEPGTEHPLGPEAVVEYRHPDDETGESEGEVWDCWGDDPIIYEVLDLDEMVRVRVPADDILTVVEDPNADGGLPDDGSGDPATACAICGDRVAKTEAVAGPAGWAVHEDCVATNSSVDTDSDRTEADQP